MYSDKFSVVLALKRIIIIIILNAHKYAGKHIRNNTYHVLEVTDVCVQIFVVQFVHNSFFHVRFQVGQIHDHTGDGIDWSTNAHFNGIIVAVPIGIVAFTVHFPVGLIVKQRTEDGI